MHFILIQTVFSHHLFYVTLLHCFLGRSYKRGLTIVVMIKRWFFKNFYPIQPMFIIGSEVFGPHKSQKHKALKTWIYLHNVLPCCIMKNIKEFLFHVPWDFNCTNLKSPNFKYFSSKFLFHMVKIFSRILKWRIIDMKLWQEVTVTLGQLS